MPDATKINAPRAIHLADYRPPLFEITETDLLFELEPRATRVRCRLSMRRAGSDQHGPLVLQGEALATVAVAIDGRVLEENEYRIDETTLTIPDVPASFVLETRCVIDPEANTELSGLYRSSGNYCTQCEPEGFRRMTWYLDRPDVLSVFTTTLVADADANPVMLCNGDRVSSRILDDGRREVVWRDPWPKPSYLFALVAGDLGCLTGEFVTRSGRRVSLEVYAQHHNMDQCDHAMASLGKAMAWDEEVYGREYDLDTCMIVAVDDFNMGAMENKGLNVFNSRYVLARPETATDSDFDGIEGVIGHEYFHNWSGNRVTCRDWFQLSLKEGFTVFRDQQFSADMGSPGVKRIGDVNLLRAHQFPEDSGPMAHPVRPDSYVEINNFYTMTVYNKGAEVVRMLYNLEGPEQFRRGCDLYFTRHDGQAVTTDDFVRAHEDAANRSFEQFRLWYAQAGTPRVSVRTEYDEKTRTCALHMSQNCPPTPGQKDKQPFHIPVRGALFDTGGQPLSCRVDADADADAVHEHVFELNRVQQTFVLHDVEREPVPSLLRGFSAPVRLDAGLGARELSVLMAHDNDPFNRWNAGQQLALAQILNALPDVAAGRSPRFDEVFMEAFGALLGSELEDASLHAFALVLPEHAIVAGEVDRINPLAIHGAIDALERTLARRFRETALERYRRFVPEPAYRFEPEQVGRRALKNRLLRLLAAADPELGDSLCREQYQRVDNMTDRMVALATSCAFGLPGAAAMLDDFHAAWREQSLIIDKWLRLQAASPVLGTVPHIRALMQHESYRASNPNKVRALIGAFCQANPAAFHVTDGAGYELLAEQVLALDPLNPQIAARLVSAFNQWRRYADPWRDLMRGCLERIGAAHGLSRDTGEIVSRALAEPD